MEHDYNDALRVAVEAAREAGALLREEFLKAGGPAGEGSHADADERAEWIIRERLLAATPEWSYRGEETGSVKGSDGRHIWLVDPNDGTKAYLQGWRGCAVSIGLLRDGEPVLGVVYAYAAPDNDGDLFSWAEGCGALQRNGVPVERGPWAAKITRQTVAIVSQSADKAAIENLRCVEPGRYEAAASVAYRFALIAAGEGEVGVALSGPGDWDYAGGHALLRSCGGEVVDERGRPVTYTRDGRSSTSNCFGGAPALLGEIARRPWGRASAAGRSFKAEPYDLCRPRRGETVADNALLQRVQDCWLGQLTGDALGSMVEFSSGADLKRSYPKGLRQIGPSLYWSTIAGQPTDDSEMALMLARTLLRDGFDEERIAEAYCWWLKSAPFDSGGTTRQAIYAMQDAESRGESRVQAARDHARRDSQANGALMRQSPLAIWGHALPPEALDSYVRADTRLTHPNQVCQDASAAFIVALAATIREGLDGTAAHQRALEWSRTHGSASVTQALEAARDTLPDFMTRKGWVLVALQNAFYQALHAESFEEGVVAAVMGGGDTDTNAAIAGALLGAIHGARAVPAQWRQAVLTCRPQKGKGMPGVHHPRPRAFWPVDALILSERLAVAGARIAPTSGEKTPRYNSPATVSPSPPEGVLDKVGERGPDRTRFVGALLGGAMGDALGRPAEGIPRPDIKARYGRLTDYRKWHGWKDGPIGTITDDTQLTMCVAECLTTHGFLDPEDLSRRFIAWLEIGRGKGDATTNAVLRLKGGTPWWKAGEDSAGNGAAMRSAPIGLARWNNPRLLRSEAILSALPTHCHPMGTAGAVAMAAATAFLVTRQRGDWTAEQFIAAIQEAIAGIETEPQAERRDPSVRSTLHDRIGLIPQLLDQDPEKVFDRLYNGAYVLESLPAALHCFLRSPEDVEETLLLAVNMGRDADTVAAMAGTLGGALGGVEALPARLLEKLEYRAELEALGNQLYGLARWGDSTKVLQEIDGGSYDPGIANSELSESDIPGPDADWQEIARFCASFNGYTYWGSGERCIDMAQECGRRFFEEGVLQSLTELRTALFWTWRWWAHQDVLLEGHLEGHEEELHGLHALIEAVRRKVQAGEIY